MPEKDSVLEEVILLPEATPVPTVAKAIRVAQALNPPPPAEDPRLSELTAQVGRLQLYVNVLFHLVLSRGLVAKEELRALVDLADLEDGVVDRQRAGDPLT